MEQSVTRCLLCIRAPALAVPYDANAHWPLGPTQSFPGAKALVSCPLAARDPEGTPISAKRL